MAARPGSARRSPRRPGGELRAAAWWRTLIPTEMLGRARRRAGGPGQRGGAGLGRCGRVEALAPSPTPRARPDHGQGRGGRPTRRSGRSQTSCSALLGADVDAQRSTPLAVVRAAVAYPTEVLSRRAGAPAGPGPLRVGTLPRRSLRAHPALRCRPWTRASATWPSPGVRPRPWPIGPATAGPRSSLNDHRRVAICSRIVHLPSVPSALMTALIGSVGPDEGPGAAPIQSVEATALVNHLVRERSAGCVAGGPFPKSARLGPVAPNEPIGGQYP